MSSTRLDKINNLRHENTVRYCFASLSLYSLTLKQCWLSQTVNQKCTWWKCTSVYQRFINTHRDQSCTCSKSSARREAGSVPDCHSQRRTCCVCLSCWRLSLPQQNKDSLTSDGQLTKRWTDLLLLHALTYEASVPSEEGVSHLLLFTDRLPLHLHPEVLIPAHAEGLLKKVNSSTFYEMHWLAAKH